MSVLGVFGQNLRKLCTNRPSIAAVCRDLDINRVQFNRYMSGYSFPKPNVLEKICNYFQVDARIILEELTDEQMELVHNGKNARSAGTEGSYLHNAVEYFERGISLGVAQYEIPDGIHCLWRNSFMDTRTAVSNLILIKTINGSRVFKSFDRPTSARRLVGKNNFNPREHRGVILSTADGFTMIGVRPHPSWYINMTYLGRAYFSDSILTGFSIVSRNEYVGRRRASRCAFELLPQQPADILPMARQAGVRRPLSDVPDIIRELIEQPFS